LTAGQGPLTALRFASDGKSLAAISRGGLFLYDVATSKARQLTGTNTLANMIHFSRDGRFLALAGKATKNGKPSGAVHLWNL
jgi:hypothetical protein